MSKNAESGNAAPRQQALIIPHKIANNVNTRNYNSARREAETAANDSSTVGPTKRLLAVRDLPFIPRSNGTLNATALQIASLLWLFVDLPELSEAPVSARCRMICCDRRFDQRG